MERAWPWPPGKRASACACAAEFRQLDFWVGQWDLTWKGGKGTNNVTREMNGCVIHEHFSGDASVENMRGESVSIYQPKLGLWRQTWVDNQGGYIPLTGGVQNDGSFLLTTTRLNDKQRQTRMIFENIKPGSFTWRWQSSGRRRQDMERRVGNHVHAQEGVAGVDS